MKIINLFHSKIFIIIINILIILLPILTIGYFFIFPAKALFVELNGADYTDTIFWTRAMVNGKGIFDKTFYYAAFLPFGGSLLMLPFYLIFGLSVTTHLLGMATFIIILALCLFFITKSFDFPLTIRLLFITICLLSFGSTSKMLEMFYGHIIYYSLSFLFMIIFIWLLNRFDAKPFENKQDCFKRLLPLCLITFLVATDGIQIIAITIIPILLAILGQCFFHNFKIFTSENKSYLILAGGIITSTLLGYIFLIILKTGVPSAGYAEAYSIFSYYSEWGNNFLTFFIDWFEILGYKNGNSLNFLIILLGVLIMVIPLLALIIYPKVSIKIKHLLLANVGVYLVILAGFTFGLLSQANWRIIPAVSFSLFTTLILIYYVQTQMSNIKEKIIPCIMLLPFILFACFSIPSFCKDKNYNENASVYKLINNLEELDLHYGFATFWQANNISVITNNKINVNIIQIDSSLLKPRYYQSSSNDYYDISDKYFVILTSNEYRQIDLSYKDTYYYTSGYYILVFAENPLTF